MGMLLRTRKSSFVVFRVICVLSVTLTYYLIGNLKQDRQDLHGNPNKPRRHLLVVENDTYVHKNCIAPTIDEFPTDGFTKEQRQHGFILLHLLLVCYSFLMLARVCDDYFIPAIKKFCDNLNMKEDTAGATVMAMASSSPELFINCVGTFITEGDLGVGTIVGSAVFNVLAVPACCGLFANMVMEVEWWPITRDTVIYSVSVVALIVVLEDGKIVVSEAAALVSIYALYIIMMCFNNQLRRMAHNCVAKFKRRNYYIEVMGETHPLLFRKDGKYHGVEQIFESEFTLEDCEKFDESIKLWTWPREGTIKTKLWWILTWPIGFILFLTIPDCRKYPKLFVVTFIMCIFWIGSTSYAVSWIITIIGDTLSIPDSVMGLTFLAAGTCVPEAVSSVIVTKQGFPTMGLSSSIGSNTFDILLCLGIPWLIKAAFYPKVPGAHFIHIHSEGLNISACALLTTLFLFYLSLAWNKFRLDWKVGLTCLITYTAFIILATLVELNVFYVVNLPTCLR